MPAALCFCVVRQLKCMHTFLIVEVIFTDEEATALKHLKD